MATARIDETVRFTFVATLTDGSSLNLTQRAGYATSDWAIAEAPNARGDRSAYTCRSAGTIEVQAYSDDVPQIVGLVLPARATLVCMP